MNDDSDKRPLSAFIDRVIGGGTPSRNVASYWNGPIPWASVKDLDEDSTLLVRTEEHISAVGLAMSTAGMVSAGVPIVCTRMAVGRCVIPISDVAINQDLKGLVPNEDTEGRYLAHGLRYLQPSLNSVAIGSTVKGLPIKQLLDFMLYKPRLGEQRRIADILDSLDERIRRTEQVISKSLLIRNGLVNDLIGRQPRGCELKDCLADMPTNGIYKPSNMIGSGSLLVGQTAFTRDRLVDYSVARRAVISRSELEHFGLENGDILVSRVYATLDGVGQPALVNGLGEPAVYESNMMRLRPDKRRADSYFMFQTLQTRVARAWVVQHANLSNQASISQSVLTSMPIWLPSLNEQHRISSILASEDERRKVCERQLRKLTLTRRGLRADLLTGRVHVPVEAAP